MIIDVTLKSVAPLVSVAESAHGFAKTCVRVYSASSFSRALIAGAKGIIIDCTPPVIKYSLLCAGALACGKAACIIGNPNFAVDAFECYFATVEG